MFFSVTLTELSFDIWPTSFLPKSTSIRCSASSFLSFKRSFFNLRSSFSVDPLFLVPAIGLRVTCLFLTFIIVSGLEHII